MATRARGGAACAQTPTVTWGSIVDSDRLPVFRAMAARARRSAGSARVENVTSRLAPMPSKLDPVSSAAITVEKRARARRYANRRRSPGKATRAGAPRGTRAAATTTAANPTTGPARNTQLVVRLYTAPFAMSFRRSW